MHLFSRIPHGPVTSPSLLLGLGVVVFLLDGCGLAGTSLTQPLLQPSTAAVPIGAQLRLHVENSAALPACAWSSSQPQVLFSLGQGRFRGESRGEALVSAHCGNDPALTAAVAVSDLPAPPLVITHGGTYSGDWHSDDPAVPAVSIRTDEPVTLLDSVVTGRGNLIDIQGQSAGANVDIHDVTGIALDPRVSGLQRGAFVSAGLVRRLRVDHCTLRGVSFGVRVLASTLTQAAITANLATDLEDRASDGLGGLLPDRPSLGHFVFLNGDTAPNGAEIGWNQVVDAMGQSSTEDVINVYKSQGTPATPIHVHDNFLEGFSSTTTASYTGTGIIADGDANLPVTANLLVEANQIVHAAGSGIEIANGHDITVRDNRIVSCGIDRAGHWFAMPFVNAIVVWNYYGAPDFGSNHIEQTGGGMVRPSPQDIPEIADLWARTTDLDGTDTTGPNAFADPCLPGGVLDPSAEDRERDAWQRKLAQAGMTPGDRHLP